MKLKLNLENFENIEFKAPDLPIMEQYRFFLERLKEWEQVTGNVKRLIKNIERIVANKGFVDVAEYYPPDKVEKSAGNPIRPDDPTKVVEIRSGVAEDSKALVSNEPLPVVAEVISTPEENGHYYDEYGEEIFHLDNLKNCTVLEEKGLTYRIIKEGYVTYLAKSHIEPEIMPLPFGVLIAEISIIEKRQWIFGKNKDGSPKLEWKAMGGGS